MYQHNQPVQFRMRRSGAARRRGRPAAAAAITAGRPPDGLDTKHADQEFNVCILICVYCCAMMFVHIVVLFSNTHF